MLSRHLCKTIKINSLVVNKKWELQLHITCSYYNSTYTYGACVNGANISLSKLSWNFGCIIDAWTWIQAKILVHLSKIEWNHRFYYIYYTIKNYHLIFTNAEHSNSKFYSIWKFKSDSTGLATFCLLFQL